MESGVSKIKVVWICHFTNETVQKYLKPRKTVVELAPWITLGIKEAEKRNDIELHIVSPHIWISGTKEFELNNIYYHFFNPWIPFYGRPWPSFFRLDIYTDFWWNKKRVKSFINKIKPNIIHLHGIENAYYSSTILQFKDKYPIIATIQGFITRQLSKTEALSKDLKKKQSVEIKLLKELNNFGVRTDDMKKYILKYNVYPSFYWHNYFLNIPTISDKIFSNSKKEYDIIFFARISKYKGIEDLIVVAGMLKKQKYRNIKIAVIGSSSFEYLKYLKNLASENDCIDNIDFLGFLPKQADVHKVLKNSKMCVLPTYNDIVPGTILESMVLKVPVVSYKTWGLPDINEKKEYLLLSEPGDLEGLRKDIEKLMDDKIYRKQLAENAYNFVMKNWNNEKAMGDIIKAYHEIIKLSK